MKKFCFLLFIIIVSPTVFAQTMLDNTFSADGKVNTAIGLYGDMVSGGTLQPDGKILVVGNGNDDAYQFYRPVISRYNTDGTLDNTFYGTGKHAYELPFYGHEYAYSPVVLDSGKILLPFSKPAGFWGFMLTRLNSNGTVDSSFGTDGIARNEVQRNVREVACAVQTDGKIVLAGSLDNLFPATGTVFFAARFNADGTVDSTFNGTGYIENDLNSSPGSYLRDLLIDGNGNIFLIGSSIQTINKGVVMSVASNGSLNNNFDTDGILYYDHNNVFTTFNGATLYSGDILIAGITNYSGTNDSLMGLVVRLNMDGTFDNTLNGTGKKEINTQNFDVTYGITSDADNKIILGGSSGPDYLNEGITFYRLNADGTFDNSFNGSGTFRFLWGSASNLSDVVVQPDGKIVGIGQVSGVNNSYYELAAVRINASGGSTAIANNTNLKNISVYPNPFSGSIAISNLTPATSNTMAEIFDATGRRICEKMPVSAQTVIEADNWQNGLYFLHIQTETEEQTIKLIKTN